MNKALLKLFELRLSPSDLKNLTTDQKAAFSVLCFAVSELNSMLRLITFSDHPIDDEPVVASASGMQATLLLRTVSSKLFEITKFLDFSGADNKTKDRDLLAFRETSKKRFADLERHPGFRVAKQIRNEAAFHYKLKPARRLVEGVPRNANHSMYLHTLNGNSFFPFGEEVLFVGLVNELSGNEKEFSSDELMENWTNWCVLAIRIANEVFLDFFEEFVEPQCPDRPAREKHYWIDPALIGSQVNNIIPVFVRQEGPQ